MANFMTYQHVIHTVACFLPKRKNQDTSRDVKLCSFNLLVLNDEVFCRKQFSKLRFDFVFDCHGFLPLCTHNKTKSRLLGDPCDAF